jgi:hypothetical protein
MRDLPNYEGSAMSKTNGSDKSTRRTWPSIRRRTFPHVRTGHGREQIARTPTTHQREIGGKLTCWRAHIFSWTSSSGAGQIDDGSRKVLVPNTCRQLLCLPEIGEPKGSHRDTDHRPSDSSSCRGTAANDASQNPCALCAPWTSWSPEEVLSGSVAARTSIRRLPPPTLLA